MWSEEHYGWKGLIEVINLPMPGKTVNQKHFHIPEYDYSIIRVLRDARVVVSIVYLFTSHIKPAQKRDIS